MKTNLEDIVREILDNNGEVFLDKIYNYIPESLPQDQVDEIIERSNKELEIAAKYLGNVYLELEKQLIKRFAYHNRQLYIKSY